MKEISSDSPTRAAPNQVVTGAVDTAQLWIARHWLALVNIGLALFVIFSFIAPLLMALGQPHLAAPIYGAYGTICHGWPFRAFFLFGPQVTYTADEIAARFGDEQVWSAIGSPDTGYKMACCERCLAISAAALALGLLYSRVRGRLAPPRLRLYLLLLVPVAVDGFTQLFGMRESTWELRLGTGIVTGLATVWFLYPYVEAISGRFISLVAAPVTTPFDGEVGSSLK